MAFFSMFRMEFKRKKTDWPMILLRECSHRWTGRSILLKRHKKWRNNWILFLWFSCGPILDQAPLKKFRVGGGRGEGEVQLVLAYLPRRRLRWSTVCPGVWIALKKYQKSANSSGMNHNMISKLKYSDRPMEIRRKPWTKDRFKLRVIEWYNQLIDWLIDTFRRVNNWLIDWLIRLLEHWQNFLAFSRSTVYTIAEWEMIPWCATITIQEKSARKLRTHLMVAPSTVRRSPSPKWSHCKPSSSLRNFLTCGSVTVQPDDKTPANPPTWSECQCVKIICEIRAFSSARSAFRLVKYSEFPFSPASIKILLFKSSMSVFKILQSTTETIGFCFYLEPVPTR